MITLTLNNNKIKNNKTGIQIVWKMPLWPKKKFMVFDRILFSLPIFDFDSSISGNNEKNKATNRKITWLSTSKNSIYNKDNNNPKAK